MHTILVFCSSLKWETEIASGTMVANAKMQRMNKYFSIRGTAASYFGFRPTPSIEISAECAFDSEPVLNGTVWPNCAYRRIIQPAKRCFIHDYFKFVGCTNVTSYACDLDAFDLGKNDFQNRTFVSEKFALEFRRNHCTI